MGNVGQAVIGQKNLEDKKAYETSAALYYPESVNIREV